MNKSYTLHSLILLVILVVAAGFGCRYFYHAIQKINLNAASAKEEIGSKAEQDARLDALKRLLADSAGDRAEASGRFVSQDGVVSFIQTVEGLAKAQGLQVKTTGVSTVELATSSKYYEQVRLDIETSGSWQKNFTFLKLIESLPYSVTLARAGFRLDEAVIDPKTKIIPTPLWKGNFQIMAVKEK